MFKTPAWTRKEGKDPAGGLNAKGRASAKAEGHNLKPPAPHPKTPQDKARKKSYCARAEGMKAKLTSSETANDPDSRINKSLRKWKCADGGAVDPYDDVQRAARQDGGSSWRLSPMERAKLAASEYFGPKQEWQTLRDQVMKSGMITPNPQGRPLTEAVNKAITMAGYPAMGQPFTYHRLNRLPEGQGTWTQRDSNKWEYTPSSWKPMPDKFEVSPEDERKIDIYQRHAIEGATPWRFKNDPMEMPTTPATPRYAAPVSGVSPWATTRPMELPLKAQAGLQSPMAQMAVASMSPYGQPTITGKPFTGSGDGVVASDRVFPVASTPSQAQIPWDQTRALEAHEQYPGRFPKIPEREWTSQGSTSMLGHLQGTGSINPNAVDPNVVRSQQQSEINDILGSLRKNEPVGPENLGPVSPAPDEGGIGQDIDKDIQSPGMAHGGPIWDKSRPKKLGKPEPLSPKEKASAKAAAKAAGRPYPNLIDNMRGARADGGQVEGDVQFADDDPYAKVQEASKLPMMAQNDFAMRMPQTEVKYDTGPQLGEATLKPYDPTIKEHIYQGIAGTEERPSPERAQFARGMSQMAEFAPVLGNVMAGQEAQRRGDTKGMLMSALPVPGMATEARMAAGAISPAQEAAREAYQRVLNAQGLYSHAAEAAANLPQAKGSYEQMMAMLQKAGVKPEEMRWSGVEQFAGQPVTREQLTQHFEQNVPEIKETVYKKGHEFPTMTTAQWEAEIARAERLGDWDYAERLNRAWEQADLGGGHGETKFEKYTVPGGENYREVLLGLSNKRLTEDEARKILGAKPDAALSQADIDYASRKAVNEYRSQHWDEPNVLGHLRMSDRTGPEGEKILHLEELQSDWGQAGYKARSAEIKRLMNEQGIDKKEAEKLVPQDFGFSRRPLSESEEKELEKLQQIRMHQLTQAEADRIGELFSRKIGKKLPSAPYVEKTQNWTDLGLKRALKEAAEGGYSKMVWTPGEEQAARYDLSKHIDELHWHRGNLVAYDKDGNKVIQRTGMSASELPDLVGKDVADKLLAQEAGSDGWRSLEGQDLKVGGEGMKSFYDKMVPTRLKELLKKIDPQAKIETDYIKTGDEWPFSARIASDGESYWLAGNSPYAEGEQRLSQKFNSYADADKQRERLYLGYHKPVHSLTITPKMREAIIKGLPAYAHGGEVVNNTDPYDNIRLKAKNFPRARRASN